MSSGDDTSRDALTAEANLARSKLLHTVEALEGRRHDALDVRLQVKRNLAPLGVAAVAIVAVVVAAVVVAGSAAARSPKLASGIRRSILVGLLAVTVLVQARHVIARLHR
jgi:hypothetical protein